MRDVKLLALNLDKNNDQVVEQLVSSNNIQALSKICVYYSYCLKRCGDSMGWHGSIGDLYSFADVSGSITIEELRNHIIELNELDCLPGYEVWYHKLSDQIVVLNKDDEYRQRYLARVLTEFYTDEPFLIS